MINRRPDANTIRVRKRDGSTEAFVMPKLLHCIQEGLIACGEPFGLDITAAGGLAEAVYDYLRASFSEAPVPSRHLVELVDLVLTQTGHTAASMAIRQHAAIRDQQRRKLMVATPRPADGRFVHRRWSKTLLVQHLRRRHQLDAPASRMIAGRVEHLILNCGLKTATSGLVRELARSELLAWGLLPGALVVKKAPRSRNSRRVADIQQENPRA